MVRLALLVEPRPDRAAGWVQHLLRRPELHLRFSFCHEPSGRSVEGGIWFRFCRRLPRGCCRPGVELVGAGCQALLGPAGLLSGSGSDLTPPVCWGYASVVNRLVESWRQAMRERGIEPGRARVVVGGLNPLGRLCLQALAAETRYLTVVGEGGGGLEMLCARILYETGVAVSLASDPERAGPADAVILTRPLPEGGSRGGFWRGQPWCCCLDRCGPAMVSIPGRMVVGKGFFAGIGWPLLAKTLPGWVSRLGREEGVRLPADYAEALLLALEGRNLDLYRREVRLAQLRELERLGEFYRLRRDGVNFP
ncbi:MAG: hypothetical protein QHH02_00910 [Syntrophomonadaceae bacterium]|nr:hypothetical protein [Syntrophomonadaceae bacterium]